MKKQSSLNLFPFTFQKKKMLERRGKKIFEKKQHFEKHEKYGQKCQIKKRLSLSVLVKHIAQVYILSQYI